MKKIFMVLVVISSFIFIKNVEGENNYEVKLGNSIEVRDYDINEYDIYNDDKIKVLKVNNYVVIEGVKCGESIIKLIHKKTTNEISFIVKVIGGKINLIKSNYYSDYNLNKGNVNFKDSKYDVFDLDDNFITSLVLNSDGKASSDYIFEFDKTYYVKEKEASIGYLKSDEKSYFIIGSNKNFTDVHVYGKVKKSSINLYKYYRNNKGVLVSDDYVTFKIFNDITGEFLRNVTFDKNGYFNIVLPYGKWKFVQNTVYRGTVVNDFIINIDGNDESIIKILTDKDINTKLKINNLDYDKNIKIYNNNIKFKIKNLDINEYVCKLDECEFNTINGEIVIPVYLNIGTYQLEQVDTYIKDYLYNNEIIKFEIGVGGQYKKDSKYGNVFSIDFYNKRVLGSVKINTFGEKEYFNNNKIMFEKIKMNSGFYKIFANQNIYNSDGTLLYKKDELVKKIVINKDNYFVDELLCGKYYLIEDNNDINYIKNNNKYNFDIEYKDQYTDNIVNEVNVYNTLYRGSLTLNIIDYYNHRGISNDLLELHVENGKEDLLVGKYSSDITGKIVIDDIPIKNGYKYYVKEIKANVDYIYDDEKIYFDFLNNKDVVINKYRKSNVGSLDVFVLEENTDKVIENVLIKLINLDNNKIYSYYSDSFGRLYLDKIDYGRYSLYEYDINNIYYINKEIINFDINDNNKYVRLKLYNRKVNKSVVSNNFIESKEYKNDIIYLDNVPNTNKNMIIFNINYFIIFIVIIILYKEVNCVIIVKKRGI